MGTGIAQSVPQNPWEMILGAQGQALGGIRDLMNNISVSGEIPYTDIGFKTGIGDLFVQQSPELLNEMSWGKSILEPGGHGPRLDSRVADLMDVMGGASVLAKPAKALVKGGLKELFDPKTLNKQAGYIVTPDNTAFDEVRGNKAFDMKLDGATDDEIFDATKTWTSHKDGVPRQEIAHGNERYMTNEELLQEHAEIMERKFFNPDSEFPLDEKRASAIENLLSNDFDVSEPGLLKDRLFNSPLEKENKEWFDSITHSEATSWDEGTLGRWTSGQWPDGDPNMMIDNNLLGANSNDAIGRLADEIKSLGIQDTVRHEGGHALTGRSGRTGGGSHDTVPNILRADLYEQIFLLNERQDFLRGIGQELNPKDVARLTKLGDHFNSINELDSDQLHALYQALSDESQSRLTQTRWQMTQPEMDADPFFKQYPVEPADMIMSPSSAPKAGFDQEVFESEVGNILKKLADEQKRKASIAPGDPTYWDN